MDLLESLWRCTDDPHAINAKSNNLFYGTCLNSRETDLSDEKKEMKSTLQLFRAWTFQPHSHTHFGILVPSSQNDQLNRPELN